MYQQISSNIQSLISPSDFLENVHINFIGKNYFFLCVINKITRYCQYFLEEKIVYTDHYK